MKMKYSHLPKNPIEIRFAIFPTKLDNGKWVWFKKYCYRPAYDTWGVTFDNSEKFEYCD